MPDLKTILEREAETVEAPDDFERLVRRRERRRRDRRVGTAVFALVVAAAAIGLVIRAFAGGQAQLPTTVPFACPPGTSPDEPGPAEQPRPPSNLTRMAFDSGSGRIVAFHALAVGSPTRTWTLSVWTYDVCANTWERSGARWDAIVVERGAPGGLTSVYDADSDLTVAFGGSGEVLAYDADTDSLSAMGPSLPEPPFRAVYDPGTGLILAQSIAVDPPELWTYDVELDAWTRVPERGAPLLAPSGDHELVANDLSAGLLVVLDGDDCLGCPAEGDRTRTVDLGTWQWSEVTAESPDLNTGLIAGGQEAAYDEATERTVVFSDGLMVAFDASAGRWETRFGDPDSHRLGNGPLSRLGHAIVYDRTNERIVVYGGSYRTPDGWVRADDVWAYDGVAGEWIQLLAPSTPYPAGSELPA